MSRYSSGPSRNWVKTKGPGWKRINERWSIFEATSKSELTEAQKTLARKRFPSRSLAVPFDAGSRDSLTQDAGESCNMEQAHALRSPLQ